MATVHQGEESGGGGVTIVTTTEANLVTLKNTSALVPGTLYRVTNPLGNAANELWVEALAADTLAIEADYLVGSSVTLVAYNPVIPSVTAYAAGSGVNTQTGWTAITGTAKKGGFNADDPSLFEVAQNVKAIYDFLATTNPFLLP